MARTVGVAAARWLLPIALLVGCGESADSAGDATIADAAGAVDGPAAPGIPWLDEGVPPIAAPSFECPMGWRAVDDGAGLTTCDPYPEGGPMSCADGEAHFPGEPGCTPVGSPCPAGSFSDVLPADTNVVYVEPGATGDGSSAASPYGSLGSFSLVALPAGTVIALSRGMHEGPVRLVRGIALWGACASATVLTASAPSDVDGVVTMRNAPGEIHDSTVADSPRIGVLLNGAATRAVLEGVVIRSTETRGLEARGGAQLLGRTVSVRDTRSQTATGDFGQGLLVDGGARVELSRALIDSSQAAGVFAYDPGTSLVVSDAVVRDTDSRASDGAFGRGIGIDEGATAELSHILVDANRELGVYAAEAGTVVTLSNLVVRDTEGVRRDGSVGRGLAVELGAVVDLDQALFERNREMCVYTGDAGSTTALSDVVVRDTDIHAFDGRGGLGLVVFGGATSDVIRGLFERNRDIGVGADGASSVMTLLDVVVRDTDTASSDGRFGRGLNVENGATAELSRGLIHGNRDVGAFAASSGSSVTLEDVVIRGTEGRRVDGTGGRGFEAQEEASAELSRVLVDDNREVGVLVDGAGSRAMLADVVVRNTDSQESDGTLGRGVSVQRGPVVELHRAIVDSNRDVGVYAQSSATATFSDVVVSNTLAKRCAETTCRDAPAGHGLGIYGGAAMSMSRFVVGGAELCGVQLADGAQVDLSDGEVRDCAIGVCLQVEPYDTTRLTRGVGFADNGTNLQATTLPVPAPVAPVEGVL